VELEYQRTRHREIGETPLARFLAGPDVLRIPAKVNAQSDDRERGFRASRSLIGAKRRRQSVG
jgi:hypothetical protein